VTREPNNDHSACLLSAPPFKFQKMQENEDDFLQLLLSGMSAPSASQSWITQSSATLPPPTLPSPRKTASKRNEIDNLLDGVDDWDWDTDLDEVSVTEAIPAQVSRRVNVVLGAFINSEYL
jgi:hypothetical protein